MYTDQMRRAIHNLHKPVNIKIDILDNEDFLVIKIDEYDFMRLPEDEKRRTFEFVLKAKAALESLGAIVLVVREAIN